MGGYLGARTMPAERGHARVPASFAQVSQVDQREMQMREDFQHWPEQNPKATLPDAQAYIDNQVKALRPFHKSEDYLDGGATNDGDAMAPVPQPSASPVSPPPAQPSPSPASSDAGKANTNSHEFLADATGYHPVPAHHPDRRMEGGFQDRAGHPIHTLEDFREHRAPYVTVAMDSTAFPYGTMLESPDLPGVPFRVADTGGAFQGKGTGRIDIARRDARGANSSENNRRMRFRVVS